MLGATPRVGPFSLLIARPYSFQAMGLDFQAMIQTVFHVEMFHGGAIVQDDIRQTFLNCHMSKISHPQGLEVESCCPIVAALLVKT